MVNKGRPLITGSIRQMTGIHYAALYVRCGSKPEVAAYLPDVRSAPGSRHGATTAAYPKSARN